MRYADLALTRALIDRLAAGGVLIVEAHLGGPLANAQVGGPRGDRFRLQPGELTSACAALEVHYTEEQQVMDPDGALMALTRIVAQRA